MSFYSFRFFFLQMFITKIHYTYSVILIHVRLFLCHFYELQNKFTKIQILICKWRLKHFVVNVKKRRNFNKIQWNSFVNWLNDIEHTFFFFANRQSNRIMNHLLNMNTCCYLHWNFVWFVLISVLQRMFVCLLAKWSLWRSFCSAQ